MNLKLGGRLAAIGSAVLLALAGCAATGDDGAGAVDGALPDVTDTASVGDEATGSAGVCAPPAGLLLDLDRASPREPQIRVPQPAGWTREKSLDSSLIRGALVNRRLPANAIVTLETGNSDVDDMFQAQFEGLAAAGATDIERDYGSLCGFRTLRADYRAPAKGSAPSRPAHALVVAVPAGARLYTVTVTVNSAQPGSATYENDARAILSGLQIVLP